MQRVHLQGGFGEKGRTSIGIDDGDTFLMFDAGIKVGGTKEAYHPRLARPADEIHAILITHAHEDHIGALNWLVGQGFRGQIYMTPSTMGEMQAVLAEYAMSVDLAAYPITDDRVELFESGEALEIGAHKIMTGHSGHVSGGVWFSIDSGGHRTTYCGDIQPDSNVFPFSPMPKSSLLLLDCSYGDDTALPTTRANRISTWVNDHSKGCVLPTPLSGRSLELLNLFDGDFAIAAGMETPLRAQLDDLSLLQSGIAERLLPRLSNARVWQPGTTLPDCPLLVHDGMGTAGPAVQALAQAETIRHPVLLTGHLPEHSPGQRLQQEGLADWLRFPTHPSLQQNIAVWEQTGRPKLLGHSCNGEALEQLKPSLPSLDVMVRTGGTISND